MHPPRLLLLRLDNPITETSQSKRKDVNTESG
jgi:hypothetical protein